MESGIERGEMTDKQQDKLHQLKLLAAKAKAAGEPLHALYPGRYNKNQNDFVRSRVNPKRFMIKPLRENGLQGEQWVAGWADLDDVAGA